MKIQSYIWSMYKAVLIFVICASISGVARATATPEGAKNFVQNVGDKVIDIVADNKTSIDKKEKLLNEMFVSTVDIDWIAKFVAGRYWRESDNEQQKKYLQVYNKYLIHTYVPKFKRYTNQKMTIGKFFAEGDDEFLVETTINDDVEGKVYKVDYKLRKGPQGFKIYDIIAEGVSMITTQRSEFGSILSREGMASLITKLDSKTDK